MALERVIDANQNPIRIRIREFLFPYTVAGAKRTMATMGKYELFMILCYIVNMVILALPSGYDDPDGDKTRTLKGFEMFFTLLYIAEIALSGVAFGFLDLLHPVRLLDSLLVLANLAILAEFYNGSNSSWSFSLLPVRCSLRILRPFFVTTEFPNVRLFVVSVARSIMQLTDVTLLFIFFLLWFGVAGVFQFGGTLQTRCVSDFHTFAALDESVAINFFGVPSSQSWISSQRNSSLNSVRLNTIYSSVIPFNAIFGRIITNQNVSERMLVEAMYTFASSFVTFYGLEKHSFVCGTEFIMSGQLAVELATALAEEEVTPPARKHYVRRVMRGGPAQASVSRTLYNATVTRSVSQSLTLQHPNIWYAHMNLISPPQLLASLNQAFQLNGVTSCSMAQTCGKNPAQALTGFICPYSYTCLPDIYNPYNNTVSFDNIGASMLALFTANTFELWYELMWWQRDASDALALAFMILEVVIGSFMIIGLMVVVLTVEYDKAKSQEHARIANELEQRKADKEAAAKAKLSGKPPPVSSSATQDKEKDPFSIFSVGRSSKKQPRTSGEIEQEMEDRKERERKAGTSFVSIVAAAARMKEDNNAADAEEQVESPPPAEEETPPAEGEQNSDEAQPTGTIFSVGVVAMFRRKLKNRLKQKREAHEKDAEEMKSMNEPGDSNTAPTPIPPKKEESSDSEEELRIEEQKQHEANKAKRALDRTTMDSDEDEDDEVDEMKLRRRAARAILRRKLEKETIPWKVKFRKLRFYAKWYIIQSRWFEAAVVLFVLASTITACTEHYGMSTRTRNIVDGLNIFFTLAFVFELATRMLADTASRFFKRFFNIFDLCNVCIGLLDIILGSIVPFLRALRVFRVFKLIDSSKELKKWILLIADACIASPMLIFILLLVMFIFSTFGMQLFGGAFCGVDIAGVTDPGPTEYYNTTTIPINFTSINGTLVPTAWKNVTELVTIASKYTTDCPNLPRANFDNFGAAMLTSFIIATGDNWNYVMYNGMTSINYAVAIPFVVYFYVAVYILMNLLVSILLSAADREHGTTEEDLLEQQRQQNEADKKKLAAGGAGPSMEDDPFAVKEYTEEDVQRLLEDGQNDASDSSKSDDDEDEEEEDDEGNDVIVSKSGKVKQKSRMGKVVEELSRMWDRSRKSLRSMIDHPAWQTLMILNILLGTVGMGFEDPIAAPDSPGAKRVRDIDLAVNIVFIVEVSLYVHIYGFVRKPTAYLRRDGWNVVDFILVSLSFFSMMMIREAGLDTTSRTMFFIFFLRALRPLRIIRRARGMRKVMSAVLGSLPDMKSVFIVTLGIFATWGVCGVFFFAGQLRSCYIEDRELPEVDEATCVTIGGNYINTDMHFDNIFFAMLTIFVCATLETWAAKMFRAMDIVALGQPFRKNANAWASLYFVVAAAFGGLIVMNLFVSVLISSYNEKKRKAAFQRSILLTKEQEAWITTNKRLARLLPIRNQKEMAREHQVAVTREGLIVYHSQVSILEPSSVVEKQEGEHVTAKVYHQVAQMRIKLREITRSSTFTNLFLTIVLANFVITAVVHYPQSESLTSTIETIQEAFTISFVIEAALKIAGESFSVYISSTWNRLDFIVALVSLASMILSSFYDAKPFSLVQTLRITRLARLTKEYFSLDRMISKFGAAILSLSHVVSLIVMVYFIYAVLGMKMFGRVLQQPFGGGGYGGASDGIDTHANFATLGNAMLLLLRLTTKGDWPDVLVSCSQAFSPPRHFCDPDIGNCGLVEPAAELYFVTFMFVATVVLTNLFTAVLLDAFGSSGLTRALRKKEADVFFQHWKQYDPDDTMTINPYDVLPFIRSLPSECVLGFNGRAKRKRIGLELNFLSSLQLVDLTHRVTWVALVDALCRAAYPIPFKARSSIAYMVYTDLLHLPMQQFAQIGRNMLEITGAAQNFGKNAFSNVQRLSRLVSGKKIRRRNANRKRIGASARKAKRSDALGDDDVANIHQDVMMFLSTMPPDCTFNPFLLPKVFLQALKAIAVSARDEMMKHFLHLSTNFAELEEAPSRAAAAGGSAAPPLSPPNNNSILVTSGTHEEPSAFSPREEGAIDDVTAPPPLNNGSLIGVDLDSLPNDSVLHLADLFPPTHPVMVMLQPTDLRDLFSKCAALVLINAVVKKRRSRLAKRVMESKIEREILSKLQRELGIVVPESVLRSSGSLSAQQRNLDAGGDVSPDASGSSPRKKSMSLHLHQQQGANGNKHFAAGSSGRGDVGSAVPLGAANSMVVLDERFTVGHRKEEPHGALSRKPSASAATQQQHDGSASAQQNDNDDGDEYEVRYQRVAARLPPKATELVPDHKALDPLKWLDADDLSPPSSPQQRGGEEGAEETASLLLPFHKGGALADAVQADPVLAANLVEEVVLTKATLMGYVAQVTEWRDLSDRLQTVLKPLIAQGVQPLVFSEDISDALALIVFRAMGIAMTFGDVVKAAASPAALNADNGFDKALATILQHATVPAMGRMPQLQHATLARQVRAGKERQNDYVNQLMDSYKALAAKADRLEKKVVDVWPPEASKMLEADALAAVSAFSKVCKAAEIEGVAAVFAGSRLPKITMQTVGNVTSQVTSGPVNQECLAYKWVSIYRALELTEYVSMQWDNIGNVRMIANARTVLTASSLKAIQYYYSVTDLADISARSRSSVAKAPAKTLGFPQAIDKLVVNSLFRSPSRYNLDSMAAVLHDVLVREVRLLIDAAAAKKPTGGAAERTSAIAAAAASPMSPDAVTSPKRKKHSSVKPSSGSVAGTLAQLVAANAAESEAASSEVVLQESVEAQLYKLLREEFTTRLEYKPQEREDPYLTSLISFCSTLSKSEKMKQESKLPQRARVNSVFASSDAERAGELIQRLPELLTLEEYQQQLRQDLDACTRSMVHALTFALDVPRKCVALAASAMKSVVKWKGAEITDFTAIAVRELIVSAALDKLNEKVEGLQAQRKLLANAEGEVQALEHICAGHRSILSSTRAYADAGNVPTNVLQDLEARMEADPDDALLLRDGSGETTMALVKTVVCPFALQPNKRAQQHTSDLLRVLGCWAQLMSRPQQPMPEDVRSLFALIGTAVQATGAVAKESLRVVSVHGEGHAATLSSMMQSLYRRQPGLDNALDAFAQSTHRVTASLNEVNRCTVRLLQCATEMIATIEGDKRRYASGRRGRPYGSPTARSGHHEAAPEMARMLQEDAGDDSNAHPTTDAPPPEERRSSSEASSQERRLRALGQSTTSMLLADDSAKQNNAASMLSKPSSASVRRAVGSRSHEQLIADAKARMEARRLGTAPSFTEVSPSPQRQPADQANASEGSPSPPRRRAVRDASPPATPLLVLPASRHVDARATAAPSPPAPLRSASSRAVHPSASSPVVQEDVPPLVREVATRVTALCRPPRPSPSQVLGFVTSMIDQKYAMRYFSLSRPATVDSGGSNARMEKLPRNDILFYPALLRLVLSPMAYSSTASSPSQVNDALANATLAITKKAKRDEARSSFYITDVVAVRYPLSILGDQDCFGSVPPAPGTSAYEEWAALVPRLVACSMASQQIHFLLCATETQAHLTFQVLDAMRDAATL